jgi:hypothetical protein
LVAFAQKGEEGTIFEDIKRILEDCKVEDIVVSVGFEWGKADYSSLPTE